MTPTPPNVTPEGRYSAAQTARALGIGRTTLWRLAQAGTLIPRYHTASLRKRYRGRDILNYWKNEI